MSYQGGDILESTHHSDMCTGIDLRKVFRIVFGIVIAVGPIAIKTTAGVLLYGALLLPIGLLRPVWCIYAMFCTCANYGVALLGPEASWTRVVIPICVTVLLTRIGISGRMPRPDRSWLCTGLVYVYVSLISLLHGRSRPPSSSAGSVCVCYACICVGRSNNDGSRGCGVWY